MHPRAASGLERCADALARSVDHVAYVGGEGARRLVGALDPSRLSRLDARGRGAATAALGLAAAGARVALIASGRDAACALMPVLRTTA